MKLRKEVSLAIIIGLIIGLVVVGGIIRARSALESVSPPQFKLSRHSPPDVSPSPQTLFLQLETLNDQVLNSPTLAVTGQTLPNTYIVILGEKTEHIIIPNELGKFTQDVVLVKGANSISVTAYQENGNKVEQQLTVVYTTAEI